MRDGALAQANTIFVTNGAVYIITPSLRDRLPSLTIPGTSCQATIVQSLRDKETNRVTRRGSGGASPYPSYAKLKTQNAKP